MRPVTTLRTTSRWRHKKVHKGRPAGVAYQAMAKWSADTPPFPARAFREWVTWVYKENRLARGLLRLRGRPADLRRIRQSLLIVTADADHIAPPANTVPLLDLVQSTDVTHFPPPGGHLALT